MKDLASSSVHARRAVIAAVVALQLVLATRGLAAPAPTFVPGPTVPFAVGFGARPQSIVVGDMNGDALADLISVDQINGAVAVLLNRGDAGFAEPQSVLLDVFPTAVTVGDLNGDTHPDVAVTDDDGGVSLLFGSRSGMIALSEQLDPGIELTDVALADLDGDGHLDLALLEVCDEVILQRNRGDGSFECFDEEIIDTGSTDPIRIVSGDPNGDGRADLMVLNRLGENVSLFAGNGDGTFAPVQQIAVGAGPRAVAVGRVDADLLDDLVVVEAGFFDDNVTVLLGDRALGLRAAATKSLAHVNASAVALADFNADRCIDFVSPSVEETAPAIGLGDCSGVFAAPLAGPALGFGSATQAADLDGDTRVDFLVVDEDGEIIRTALNQTPAPCPGDCDGSGAVAVNELIIGVNILLERAPLDVCPGADLNGDGRITVDELVRAVNNLLTGCAEAQKR